MTSASSFPSSDAAGEETGGSRVEQAEETPTAITPSVNSAHSDTPSTAPAPLVRSKDEGEPGGGSARRKAVNSLLNLGVAVLFYDDPGDPRPSYCNPRFSTRGTEVKAIFINRKHPSFVRCSKGGLVEHIIRLVANELVAMSFEGSEHAIDVANRLYGLALGYK